MSFLSAAARTFLFFSLLLSSVVFAEPVVVNFEFEVTELIDHEAPNFVVFEIGDRVTGSFGYDSDAERTVDSLNSMLYPVDFIEVNFDDRFVRRFTEFVWMDVWEDTQRNILVRSVDSSTEDQVLQVRLSGTALVDSLFPPTSLNVNQSTTGLASATEFVGENFVAIRPNVRDMRLVSVSVVPEPTSACSFLIGFVLLFRFLIVQLSFSSMSETTTTVGMTLA